MARELPEPPDAGLLNAVRFGTQTFRFLEGIQSRFDDIVGIPIPGRGPLVLVTNPELVHDALSRPDEFSRVPAQGPAAMIAEQGLVQSEGSLWRQQREIMGPSFSGPQVRAYANTVGERVQGMVGEWHDALDARAGPTAATDGGAVGQHGPATTGDGAEPTLSRNLHREMTALTVRVASEVLLGEDIGRERATQFHSWMSVAGDEFEFDASAAAPEWVPQRTDPEFERAATNVKGLAEEMIDRRRAEMAAGENEGMDMLTLLLAREDDPEIDYPPNQIRDEVATFLIAGHETTALSLTYTQSLLAWHPEVRERVREEAREVLGEGTPQHEHVSELEYTGRVFQEALRLYPAAWAVFRQTTDPVGLGDYRVPEDATIIMPQWSIHRDPRYFEDPGTFDPDRWEGRNPQAVEAYFPFSSGPHACIGRQFSLTGARLGLAAIVRDFDVDVPEGALDDLRATPTLRPPDGVPATVRRAD